LAVDPDVLTGDHAIAECRHAAIDRDAPVDDPALEFTARTETDPREDLLEFFAGRVRWFSGQSLMAGASPSAGAASTGAR